MKLLTVFVLFFGFAIASQAQDVNFNGNTYTIKGKKILMEGADVTTVLSAENQAGVWQAFKEQEALLKAQEQAIKAEKELEKAEKAAAKEAKKLEKERKAIEKEKKRVEKFLKAKEKAQSNFEDATKNYNNGVEKYEKLKNKGKLSPNDEAKWLKKINKLQENLQKAQGKL